MPDGLEGLEPNPVEGLASVSVEGLASVPVDGPGAAPAEAEGPRIGSSVNEALSAITVEEYTVSNPTECSGICCRSRLIKDGSAVGSDLGEDLGDVAPEEVPSLDLRDCAARSILALNPGLCIPPPNPVADVNDSSKLDTSESRLTLGDKRESILCLADLSRLILFLCSGLAPARMMPPPPDVCEDAAETLDRPDRPFFCGSFPDAVSKAIKFAALSLCGSGSSEGPAAAPVEGLAPFGGRIGSVGPRFSQDTPSLRQQIPFPNPPGGSASGAGDMSGRSRGSLSGPNVGGPDPTQNFRDSSVCCASGGGGPGTQGGGGPAGRGYDEAPSAELCPGPVREFLASRLWAVLAPG